MILEAVFKHEVNREVSSKMNKQTRKNTGIRKTKKQSSHKIIKQYGCYKPQMCSK